jgi:hypothetical protein
MQHYFPKVKSYKWPNEPLVLALWPGSDFVCRCEQYLNLPCALEGKLYVLPECSKHVCCQATNTHRILTTGGIDFLPQPPHRKPFPIGDKVTFSGKECVCQTCSQSMTSSKPIKIHGPSRESSPHHLPELRHCLQGSLSWHRGWPHPGRLLKQDPVGIQPRHTAPYHNKGKTGCPAASGDGQCHLADTYMGLFWDKPGC